jgi:hypothetical protein
VSKNKVGKEREGKGRKGKEREGKEEFGLATSHMSVGKWGGAIITKFCTRVYVGYVMILANFSVDISRGVNSVRG